MLVDTLKWADADKWVTATLAEIDDHVWNGTWVLTQFPLVEGRSVHVGCLIKVKCLPDGAVDNYKGQIVAQGFSQVQGIHYNEVFAPTARMAAVRTVIVIAAMPAPPTPFIGILGVCDHSCFLFSFRDYVATHLHNLWLG